MVREGILRSERCIRAMLQVKRHLFIDERHAKWAYEDTPLPLGNTGQTISAPHMCAYMLEALEPQLGHNVLEVGGGSGYQAALLAEVVAPSDTPKEMWGRVVTIEILDPLCELAKRNLKRADYSDRVLVVCGDGTLGYPPLEKGGLYDRILITAGGPDVPPPLLEQLKREGILVAPVGGRFTQELIRIRKKKSGELIRERLLPCRFVPLRGRFGWEGI